MNNSNNPIVRLDQIVKTFFGVKALNKMSFDLYPGEIHGLVGENGAGKSTLMKVLSGAHPPDSGEIEVYGKVYNLSLIHIFFCGGGYNRSGYRGNCSYRNRKCC